MSFDRSISGKRQRLIFTAGAITSCWILLIQYVAIGSTGPGCDTIQIVSNDLSLDEAEQYCHYATVERKKVQAFWGATWTDIIHIDVDERYKLSRALTTKTRGFIEMPLKVVREQRSALLHEIVHVYAPNTNRFLAEGLAVYLQQKLGGNPAFPNFGKDLRVLAGDRLSLVSSLESLNKVRTPRPLRTVMQEQAAYILAGSFVEFLIEKYGLTMFRSLYDIDSYESVYAKNLAALEKEWRTELQLRSQR